MATVTFIFSVYPSELLDDLTDRRGYSHLKEETLDRTMWRNRFRGGFGPVVRQNTEWMNEYPSACTTVISNGRNFVNIQI